VQSVLRFGLPKLWMSMQAVLLTNNAVFFCSRVLVLLLSAQTQAAQQVCCSQ
jgi:hypothetical protein